MNTDNVTPIRPGEQPPSPPKKPRTRRAKPTGLLLAESEEGDGFSTLDVLNALYGICVALDTGHFERDINVNGNMQTAAKILATILANRVT
jgi:hypothetical protein